VQSKISDLLNVPLPEAAIEPLKFHWLEGADSELYVLRLDQVHPFASGNKWFKLLFNLNVSIEASAKVLTFGGAFSNHIASFVATAISLNIKPVCVIRGDELSPQSNLLLTELARQGAEFIFVSREDYKNKYSEALIEYYQSLVGDFLMIPEGGANLQGDLGCCLIARYILDSQIGFSDVFLASGTGATSAGLISGLKYLNDSKIDPPCVHSVSMFKGEWMRQAILDKCIDLDSYFSDQGDVKMPVSFILESMQGQTKYGRLDDALFEFINEVYENSGLLLDPVYTAKVILHIKQQLERGALDHRKLLFVHTGGLSGWLGYPERWLNQLGGERPFQLSGTIKNRLIESGIWEA
jgi:1-aminocyclopropane-1-carboxylate deaminase